MVLAIVLIILVTGTVLFHLFNPWGFTPIASNWGMIDGTVSLTFWVTGFVFIAVNLFVAYSIIRYRYREGARAHYEPENKKLETILTVVTTLGIMALLAPGLFVWGKFVAVPEDALEVEVIGQQWNWSYRFPGADGTLGASDARFFSDSNPAGLDPRDPKGQDDILVFSDDLHIPVDVPIKILSRSKDVLHNFAVPQFRVKMDMVPGMVTHFWFTATRTGVYDVLCMELCGIGHYAMRGRVVVDTTADFFQWLGSQTTFVDTQVDLVKLAEAGSAHFVTCVACHGVNAEGKAEMSAPRLAGLDQSYIARQLRNFKSGRRGTNSADMPGQQMAAMANILPDDAAINGVAAYISTLPLPAGAVNPADVTGDVTGDVAHGKSLYQNCSVCHGESGQGLWSTGAPRLAGMQSNYIATQLKHFREGIRGYHPDDKYGQQMAAMAYILGGDQAINDVVSYISTLEAASPGVDSTTQVVLAREN